MGLGQGRESKGRLITPYRSEAFLRDVINLIPKGPVCCHWSSHKGSLNKNKAKKLTNVKILICQMFKIYFKPF